MGKSDSNPKCFHSSWVSEEDSEPINVLSLALPHVVPHNDELLWLPSKINVVLPNTIKLCLKF